MLVLSPLIGVSSLFIVLCSYIYLLMYAVFHSRSNTLYRADYFLLSTKRLKMSVPEQNAPDLREEGSSSTSSDRFHFLVQKAAADSMASVTREISSLIDARFVNFKEQFTEENSSSVEAAVKRAKRARFVFQSKGNEQQFEHAESVLDKLESAKDALNANATSKAKTAIEEGIALVTKRMKVIKIADKSQYSWATVQEYLSDELASDSEDENSRGYFARRGEQRRKLKRRRRSALRSISSRDFSLIRRSTLTAVLPYRLRIRILVQQVAVAVILAFVVDRLARVLR